MPLPPHYQRLPEAEMVSRAEAEELESYTRRATDAPWIVVLFAEKYGLNPDGSHRKNYYVEESVGIAAGLFIAAVHRMGLVTLTHTPNPMGFIRDLLGRGTNEKAAIVFPVGYPARDAQVPDIARMKGEQFIQWNVPGERGA